MPNSWMWLWMVVSLTFVDGQITHICGWSYHSHSLHFQNIFFHEDGNLELIDNENCLDYDIWKCGFDSIFLPTSQKQVGQATLCAKGLLSPGLRSLDK